MAFRTDLSHFKNHTNNRVESFFGKVKHSLKGHYSMHQCVVALLAWQRRKEDEYSTEVQMPGTRRDVTYSDEMNIVLGLTTRWVASAVATQYDFAVLRENASKYAFADNGSSVTVRRDGREYLIIKESWKCDCEFALTIQLPCWHTMMYRQHIGSPFVIPYSDISTRYGVRSCSPTSNFC